MPDLADLYPGFASHWIDTRAGRIFARSGGEGPPLLLLHGYPQTNVMWHRVAPALAAQFSLIIPDLPGYGWSDAPPSDAALTVVMAAKGYPGNYDKGSVIEGLDAAAQVDGVEIFHAGTKADGGASDQP